MSNTLFTKQTETYIKNFRLFAKKINLKKSHYKGKKRKFVTMGGEEC